MVPEKSMLPSRFLSCLLAILMLFLILTSLSLLQFNDNSSMSQSFFRVILVNNRSAQFNSNIKPPLISSETLIKQDGDKNRGGLDLRDEDDDKRKSCNPVVKVYMYDLSPEFHFGLLGWTSQGNQNWPNITNPTQIPSYPGGLNLQHSIEYWLTLDLLSSDNLNIIRPCTAIRVHEPTQANVIFVPFFSSLSYNRYSKLHGNEKVSLNTKLQEKLVNFLNGRDEWNRLGGKDHLIVAHHPNSMLNARSKLGPAMFVLADFGRYPVELANLDKDVIAPYKHMVRNISDHNSPSFNDRPTLIYFQGAIYRKDGGVIRQELYYLLKDEKDVHFAFGSIGSNGVKEAGQGMVSSKFCLNIAGDTPSSNRLFDAIASHCIPVIISDEIELPFEDVLDYSEFSIFVQASDAVKKGYLVNLLRGVNEEKWIKMWERLKKVAKHFEYEFPSQPGDAVDMIWQAVSRKILSKETSKELNVYRKNRFRRSQILLNGLSVS